LKPASCLATKFRRVLVAVMGHEQSKSHSMVFEKRIIVVVFTV